MTVLYLLLSVAAIILLTTRLHLHPFLALLLVAIGFGLLAGMPTPLILESINEGFGGTLGKIGLIIVLGVIIGAFLERTGGAYAIAERLLRLVGKKRVPTAMGLIGYLVSIPVFADSGFVLLSPLGKSLSKKAGISLSGTAIALGMGLMASHTMVPPTPGPIAAAGILGANLGVVLMVGIPISLIALGVAILFAHYYVARTYIDPAPELEEAEVNELLAAAPGAGLATLPIVVPILLIVGKSLFGSADPLTETGAVAGAINFVGEPVIALLIGLGFALLLPRKLNRDMLSSSGWVGKALQDASSIILITGAGGIFGKMLYNSGIADLLGETLADANLSVWLPFLLAAAIKSAQGSSTVALITAASIIMPMMDRLGFETELQKALVVVSIGAGSAVVSHANDSFFWVVTQLSGMNTKMGYRFFTLASFVLGATAAMTVFITYLIFT